MIRVIRADPCESVSDCDVRWCDVFAPFAPFAPFVASRFDPRNR